MYKTYYAKNMYMVKKDNTYAVVKAKDPATLETMYKDGKIDEYHNLIVHNADIQEA